MPNKEIRPFSAKQLEFQTTNQHSFRLSKVKSKNTKPEILLRKKLWSLGIRYRLNVKKLPGKPDIVINKHKIAIFVDGEFWHGFNWEQNKRRIKSNKEYWIPKIEKNILRDDLNNNQLNELGYHVIRFWENDVKKNIEHCIEKILNIVNPS